MCSPNLNYRVRARTIRVCQTSGFLRRASSGHRKLKTTPSASQLHRASDPVSPRGSPYTSRLISSSKSCRNPARERERKSRKCRDKLLYLVLFNVIFRFNEQVSQHLRADVRRVRAIRNEFHLSCRDAIEDHPGNNALEPTSA